MHTACMATKTISLRTEAYEKLKQARRYPEESFSEVVLRASWPETTVSGRELLELYASHGPFFESATLAALDERQEEDEPPSDKWAS